MNLETEYRAWHQKSQRMIPVHGWHKDFVFEETMDGADLGNNILPTEECILMQYIKRNDGQNQRLYDGDIIELKSAFKDRYYIGVIIRDKHRFVAKDFNFAHYDDPTEIFSEEKDKIKKLGNIYQNPELFKF